jgi:hypothetical protein
MKNVIRGQSEAIRWQSEGNQRPSEAIRGHSRHSEARACSKMIQSARAAKLGDEDVTTTAESRSNGPRNACSHTCMLVDGSRAANGSSKRATAGAA